MSETETSYSGPRGGLLPILLAVIAAWAALHMDRTHAVASRTATNVDLLPPDLAEWLAWAFITYGGLILLVIAVAVIVILGAILWALAGITAEQV